MVAFKPQWINPCGFLLRDTGVKVPGGLPWLRPAIYEFELDPFGPLTFRAAPHCYIRSDWHYFTDLRTGAVIINIVVPRDMDNKSWVLHDSACVYHGLWFSSELDGEYRFCPVASSSAHDLLETCLVASGYEYRGPLAGKAVRRFGPKWKVSDLGMGDDRLRQAVMEARRCALQLFGK